MKTNNTLRSFSTLLVLWLLGCTEVANNTSIIPKIEFKDLYIIKNDYYNLLVLELIVEDGDGDIGLYNYTEEPYNLQFYFKKQNGELLKYSDRNTAPYDTIPPFEFPYYCTNYSIEKSDTFYIEKNINHYNIFIDFYVKRNNDFELINFETIAAPHCGETSNGRIWEVKNNPLGPEIIEYRMGAHSLPIIFKGDSAKVVVQIQDRAFNKSNIEETFTFIMSDLEVKS